MQYKSEPLNPLEAAKLIAYMVHKDQTDLGGSEYLRHVKRVAERFVFHTELIVPAYLHDAIEDSDLRVGNLYSFGFSLETVATVDALTRRKDETWKQYILRVANNEHARRIKMADLEDNLNVTRLNKKRLRKDDLRRINQYLFAYNLLKGYDDAS